MTGEEKGKVRELILEAMDEYNLQGTQVRMAISQAVWRAVGYAERCVLFEAKKRMEPNRFQELEMIVTR